MPGAGELPHPELNQLPDDVRRVVLELGLNMPPNSWTIESIAVTDISKTSHLFLLHVELRGKQGVRNRLLGGKSGSLRIITPNTMVVGIYPRNQRQAVPIRYGMFSQLSREKYDPKRVVDVLGGTPNDVSSHGPIDLMKVAGRYRGTLSPVIGEEYLKGFTAVEFSESLVFQASEPNAAVAYPLGVDLYYIARGREFLRAYHSLLSRIGVGNNLELSVTDQPAL